MSAGITHEGHEYRPAAEVQPREGDRVAMLDRLGAGHPWATAEGPVTRVRGVLVLGAYELRNEYGWTKRPVRIVQRAQPVKPTGLGAVVRAGGEVWVRVDVTDCFSWRSVDGTPAGGGFASWRAICNLGPVEVLSDGWTEEP